MVPRAFPNYADLDLQPTIKGPLQGAVPPSSREKEVEYVEVQAPPPAPPTASSGATAAASGEEVKRKKKRTKPAIKVQDPSRRRKLDTCDCMSVILCVCLSTVCFKMRVVAM